MATTVDSEQVKGAVRDVRANCNGGAVRWLLRQHRMLRPRRTGELGRARLLR